MDSSIEEDIYGDSAHEDTTYTYSDAAEEEQHLTATSTSNEPVATNKEIWGWYMFGWAADGYTAATSGVFQPLIISAMAKAAGRSTIDHASQCTSSTTCEVLFGTVWVSPTQYALYSSVIAIVVQVVITISLGALADHSGNGKIYMFIFCLLGCISVMLWLALTDPTWIMGANILNIVGNVTYGGAYVFNAGYLPKLARNHPDVLNATTEQEREDKLAFRTSRLSIFGSAVGYFGGFVQMIIGVAILLAMNQTLYSVRLATFFGGIWWAVFAIIPMFLLKRRPGPPLPKGSHYLTYPWKQMYRRFRYAYKLAQLFLFLLFWFFVSDAASTVIQVTVLFAQNEVNVSSTIILIGALVELISAVPGMFISHWIQTRFKISVKTIIFVVTLLAGFVPLYIIGGLAPTPGGFKTPPEFIFLCAFYGLMQPTLVAFSRALFSELIPKGHENEMFALFSVSTAGGGWIGPLVSGAIGGATGSLRYAMIFVVASMYIPLVLLYFIDISKGVSQARLFVEPENNRKLYQDSTELEPMVSDSLN